MSKNKVHSSIHIFFLSTLFAVFTLPSKAASLDGFFSSPFGLIELKSDSGGSITGRLKSSDQCGRKPGSVIFTGSQLEDSITGSLKTCFQGLDVCRNDEVNAPVLLLMSPDRAKLTGVAHLPPPPSSCEAVLKKEGVVFKRHQKKNKKRVTQPKTKSHRKIKAPAQTLARTRIIKGQQLAKESKETVNVEVLLKKALSLIGQGKAEDARAIFTQIIELNQKLEVAYNGLGVTFYLRERYEEAAKAYKKAIEINPMYPDTYYNLACLFSLQQNKEQAFRYLKMAFLNGYIDVQTLDTDNDLDNLRSDARFEELKNGSF